MPVEDKLTYKVELDASDIAGQLQALRDQVALESGASAFGGMGLDPTAFTFNPFSGGDIGGGVAAPIGPPPQISPSFSPDMGTSIANQFDSMINRARLGYEKFSSAMEMSGLLTPAPYVSTSDLNTVGIGSNMAGVDYWNQIRLGAESGTVMGNTLTGALGLGYHPSMPLSREEFTTLHGDRGMRSIAGQELAYDVLSLGITAPLASALGGSIGGPLGIVAGLAAGLGADAIFRPDYHEDKRVLQRANYLQNISFRSVGGPLDQFESRQLATRMGEWEYSGMGIEQGFRPGEIDTMVNEFAAAGGFDYSRTADEFKRNIDNLIENARTVMHTLHMSTKEASNFMGEMSSLGVTDAGTITSITSLLGNAPTTMGLTPGEALQMGRSATNIVQGTGLSMGAAFTGALTAAGAIHGMAAQGLIDPNVIRNSGGVSQMALDMERSALNFARSSSGFAMNTAMMAGGPGMAGAGVVDQFYTASNFIGRTGMMGYLTAVGGQEDIINTTPSTIYDAQNLSQYMQLASWASGGREYNQTAFKGFLLTQGINSSQAERWSAIAANPEEYRDSLMDLAPNLMEVAQNARGRVGGLERIWRNFAIGWDETVGQHITRPTGEFVERATRGPRSAIGEMAQDISDWFTGDTTVNNLRVSRSYGDLSTSEQAARRAAVSVWSSSADRDKLDNLATIGGDTVQSWSELILNENNITNREFKNLTGGSLRELQDAVMQGNLTKESFLEKFSDQETLGTQLYNYWTAGEFNVKDANLPRWAKGRSKVIPKLAVQSTQQSLANLEVAAAIDVGMSAFDVNSSIGMTMMDTIAKTETKEDYDRLVQTANLTFNNPDAFGKIGLTYENRADARQQLAEFAIGAANNQSNKAILQTDEQTRSAIKAAYGDTEKLTSQAETVFSSLNRFDSLVQSLPEDAAKGSLADQLKNADLDAAGKMQFTLSMQLEDLISILKRAPWAQTTKNYVSPEGSMY